MITTTDKLENVKGDGFLKVANLYAINTLRMIGKNDFSMKDEYKLKSL